MTFISELVADDELGTGSDKEEVVKEDEDEDDDDSDDDDGEDW